MTAATSSDGVPRDVTVATINTQGTMPMGYRQFAVPSGSAGAVSPPDAPTGATMVVIKAEGGPIRYRDDGVDPTAAVGMPLAVGESMVYDARMVNLRLIAQEASPTTTLCNAAFYGPAN